MALKKWSRRIVIGIVMLTPLFAGIAWSLQRQGQAEMVGSTSIPPMHITSASFTDGENMPPKLTCDGLNISPDLQLPAPPTGTRSFAIVVDDPDAPIEFTHWIAYNIAPDTRDVPEGASTPTKRFDHAVEGINSFGNIGYGGPCPPSGKAHHYVFRVYALDINPALPPGQTREQLATMVHGHVLAEGEMTGLYGR